MSKPISRKEEVEYRSMSYQNTLCDNYVLFLDTERRKVHIYVFNKYFMNDYHQKFKIYLYPRNLHQIFQYQQGVHWQRD